MFHYLVMLAVAMLLQACSGSTTVNPKPKPLPILPDNAITDSFVMNDLNNDNYTQGGQGGSADIVFVIDNSKSMLDEQLSIGTAATTLPQAISNYLAGVDLRISFITTNTFGSSFDQYDGTFWENPAPHPGQSLGREVTCTDPADPDSAYWGGPTHDPNRASYCAWSWVTNGTLGHPVLFPEDGYFPYNNPNAIKFLTGNEPDFATLIAQGARRGRAGDQYESPAMATRMMLGLSAADSPLRGPTTNLNIIAITDAEDASIDHCSPTYQSPWLNCIYNDSRQDPDPDPNTLDYTNIAYYFDLNNQFTNFLYNYKADPRLIRFDLIAGIPNVSGCGTLESINHRMTDFVTNWNIANNTNWLVGDICNLTTFDQYIQQIALGLTDQLNKQFNLSQTANVWLPSLKVLVNNVLQPAANYTYVSPGVVIFDTAPVIGAQVDLKYWVPQLSAALSSQPLPNTIIVSKQNASGSYEVIPASAWHYDGFTNSVVFDDPATAPQPLQNYKVKYNPSGEE